MDGTGWVKPVRNLCGSLVTWHGGRAGEGLKKNKRRFWHSGCGAKDHRLKKEVNYGDGCKKKETAFVSAGMARQVVYNHLTGVKHYLPDNSQTEKESEEGVWYFEFDGRKWCDPKPLIPQTIHVKDELSQTPSPPPKRARVTTVKEELSPCTGPQAKHAKATLKSNPDVLHHLVVGAYGIGGETWRGGAWHGGCGQTRATHAESSALGAR